jgi:D-psicose/D-tagatose/L-ribulose 3-epimerase
MKLALCNEAFERSTWVDTVRVIAEAGYDGVEVSPYTLAESVVGLSAADRATIRKQAEDVGLEVVGLHWLFVSPKGLHATTRDAATRQRTTAYLQELVRFCGDLGGRVMVVGSPQQRAVQPDVRYEEAWKWFVDMIRACLDLAAERRVTLCMEAVPASMTNFVNTLAEAVQMVREIDHPWFQTMFDVHNACDETDPLPDLVQRYMPYIKHVHVNEMNGGHPGSGNFDFRPILRVLEQAHYDGYVSVEAFDFSPGGEQIARESIRALRAASE